MCTLIKLRKILLDFIFAVLALSSFPSLTFSQSQQEKITEIIIHASPLAENNQNYAGSASIYRPDASINNSNTQITDIIQSTPNFTWAGGSSAPRFLQIRGIGELEQYEGAPNPSVGLVFDDIDLSGLGIPMTMFDVEQVEVLRGPQATRFGANGLAGVVSIRSTEPSKFESATSMLSIGNDELYSTGLGFGGTILNSKDLSYRISIAHEQSNGFRKDLYLNRNDTNEKENSDVIAQIRFQPTYETKLDLEGIYARQDDGYDAFALNNAFTTQSDRPGKDEHDLAGSKLFIEHLIDNSIRVQSITSYSSSNLNYGFDGDWGNNIFWGANAPYDYRSASSRDRDVISEEIRLSSASQESDSWLLGVFGQHLKENSQIDEFQNEVRYDELSTNYKADSLAGFAAVERSLNQSISIGSTLRAEHRSTDYIDSNLKSFEPDFNMQGGSAYLKYKVSEKNQLYSLVSRGFKGGGFNAGTRIPDIRTQYDPESLWNYEIGAKGSGLSELFTYGISAFWMQRYNQQIKLALQDNPEDPLSFSYLTDNAGQGRNLGLEGDIAANISETFQLSLNAGILESKITSVDAALSNLQDREQSSAPPWNYSLKARYLITDCWYLNTSLNGQDSFYFDDSHNQKSNPYSLLGAEIGWLNGNLKIALWGKNLSNQKYATRGFYFGNEPPDFPNKLYIQRGDPTSFGMTLSYQ